MARTFSFRRALSMASQVVVLLAFVGGCSEQTFDARVRVDGIDTPAPDPAVLRDADVATIYDLARVRDESHLAGLADSARKNGRPVDPAVALSLFTIDRAKYHDLFIEAYPATRDAVVGDYASRFAHANLAVEGVALAPHALADLALGGDTQALAKLFGAMAVSDGTSVHGVYADEVTRVIAAQPGPALTALTRVDVPRRMALLSETDWCGRRPHSWLTYSGAPDAPEAAIVTTLRADMAENCAAPRKAARRVAKRMRHATVRAPHTAPVHR